MGKAVKFKGKAGETSKTHGKRILVTRVSPMMHEDIKNVAGHLGVSVTDFCKVNLLNIITTYPAHYLKPIDKE
jgi:hypothetical protein